MSFRMIGIRDCVLCRISKNNNRYNIFRGRRNTRDIFINLLELLGCSDADFLRWVVFWSIRSLFLGRLFLRNMFVIINFEKLRKFYKIVVFVVLFLSLKINN